MNFLDSLFLALLVVVVAGVCDQLATWLGTSVLLVAAIGLAALTLIAFRDRIQI